MPAKAPARRVIRLPQPMAHQLPVLRSNARYKWLACGRRWGKSILAMIAGVGGHGDNLPGAIDGVPIWWVAPDYKQATMIWDELRYALADCEKNEAERRITLPNGGSITVKSAENPTALRGSGIAGVILDEAAFMAPEVWTQAIRPALSDRQGWAIIISTPRGLNWFYEGWRAAEGDAASECWQAPTAQNDRIPAAEIADARSRLRPAEFRQEYEADFTSLADSRFDVAVLDQHEAMCSDPLPLRALPAEYGGIPGLRVWELPRPGEPYVMYSDTCEGLPTSDPSPTVVLAPRRMQHVATIYGKLEPSALADASARLGMLYNRALWDIERNNHGHAVILAARDLIKYPRLQFNPERDQTRQQRTAGTVPAERLGLNINAQTKHLLVDDLADAIHSYSLHSPDKAFWQECRWFEVKPNGSAAAMEGAHDDYVMAMAGALRLCRQPGAMSVLRTGEQRQPTTRQYRYA